MRMLEMFRVCRHEIGILFLDGKLLSTLTLVPCIFILILSVKGPAPSRDFTFFLPLPPELPAGEDESIQALYNYLVDGEPGIQTVLGECFTEDIRSVLLSNAPSESDLAKAEQAIASYYRNASAEQKGKLYAIAVPSVLARLNDDQLSSVSAGAIVHRLIINLRSQNQWLIHARGDFSAKLLGKLLPRSASISSQTNRWRNSLRVELQDYYFEPVKGTLPDDPVQALRLVAESWVRYTGLSQHFAPLRNRDPFEGPSSHLLEMYSFLGRVFGTGHVRVYGVGDTFPGGLEELEDNHTAFYWNGTWEASVRGVTATQDTHGQQSRASALMVLNLYSLVTSMSDAERSEAVSADLVHVVTDSLLQFGDTHYSYNRKVDEDWRGMIVLGFFPPVIAFFLASGQLQRDRQYGLLPLLLVATGNRRFVFIAGRSVAVVFAATMNFAIIAAVSFVCSDLPGHLPSVRETVGLLVCLFSACLSGSACSFWIRSERQTYFVTAVLILASILFGGAVESMMNAAPISRFIGTCLPSSAFFAVLRDWAAESTYPMTWFQVMQHCIQPLCIGVGAILFSLFSWREYY